MEGIVVSYRRGRTTQKNKHMIIKVHGINNKEKASKLINKRVVWKSPAGKELIGEIKNIHGNNGALRVIFTKGLPGQAIGDKIKIE